MAVSVALIHDHAALREGLKLLLVDSGIDVVGTTSDFESAIELAAEKGPDVVFIDLEIRGRPVTELVEALREQEVAKSILIYCGGSVAKLRDCLMLGADGCVSKQGGRQELVEAIEAIADGREYRDRRIDVDSITSNGGEDRGSLSPREREVMQLLTSGMTGVEAAKELVLSPETVRTHVRNALDKLDAKTRAHGVAKALVQGYVDTE